MLTESQRMISTLDRTNNFWNNGLGSSPSLVRVAADAVSWVRRLGVTTGLTVGIAAGAVSWAVPALALQVQLSPKNPQLGDTMSVMIRLDKPATNNARPTVKMNQKTYQTFAVGPNRFRALLPSTPLDRPGTWKIEVAGEGQVRNLAVQLRDRDFPTQSIWLPPGKDGDVSDYEFDLVDAFKQLQTPQKFWKGAFLRPNAGEITTIYGVRRYYNGKFAEDYYHRGVDYAGAYGSSVVAPAAGRVALVGREADGFAIHGNCIGIDHGQGVTTIYLHLSRINVKEGDMVKPGQVIGAVGNSGASTGPHLHWGLYVNGLSVDPVPWRYQGFE
ncbi:M23 family metallopeptidase [Microcoleus sp. FACHB-672]|uniref:M23 family metallopeptidase n=1 Tax=Microcoleus sp. FACHB-672 TaxID=2692825 RepID=UPI001986443F|nr:M23 family metallopeptidase [Microcoleus sp. FACHB-672]MBD2041783.1 peptidoglycan DD-metalloendopeptidase family protein [Microcoleus sp. FACHB-672]